MKCAGCDADLPARSGRGNPRRWCSESCRVKAWRAVNAGRVDLASAYAPRSSIGYAECSYCQRLYITQCRRPLEGRRACNRDDCQRAATNERARNGKYSTKSRQKLGRPQSTKAADLRRRAIKKGATEIESFTRIEIFERDQWLCGICGKSVPQSLTWPHPLSPTIDHIVPLSKKGTHTRANVRTAHLSCNSARGNRGGPEQLRLVG